MSGDRGGPSAGNSVTGPESLSMNPGCNEAERRAASQGRRSEAPGGVAAVRYIEDDSGRERRMAALQPAAVGRGSWIGSRGSTGLVVRLRRWGAGFLRDQRGSDSVETIVLVAFVVLPVAAYFAMNRSRYYQDLWDLWSQVARAAYPNKP